MPGNEARVVSHKHLPGVHLASTVASGIAITIYEREFATDDAEYSIQLKDSR